ncbi:MAG: hypothetical protein LBN04_05065 [Oscillospiraceae bacterium]|jgi:hypothetical protein|nr:hypothetical protein [Oscillospiraceae bacterium]
MSPNGVLNPIQPEEQRLTDTAEACEYPMVDKLPFGKQTKAVFRGVHVINVGVFLFLLYLFTMDVLFGLSIVPKQVSTALRNAITSAHAMAILAIGFAIKDRVSK